MKLISKEIAFGLALSLASSVVYAQVPEVPKKVNEPTPMPMGMSPKGQYGIATQNDIDQMMVIVEGIGSSSRDALYEKTLKSFMMPPRNVHVN